MQIKLDPYDILMIKLTKIKCCQGCQNPINYLVYGIGLYCTQCLAKLKYVTPEHFINLEELAKVIAGLAQKYRSNQKSNSGKVMLKVEAENCMKECEQLRDSIIVDIKSITSKANTIVYDLSQQCDAYHNSSMLYALFYTNSGENDIEIITNHLQNFHIASECSNPTYEYRYIDKQQTKSFERAEEAYQKISKCIAKLASATDTIMENFRNSQ